MCVENEWTSERYQFFVKAWTYCYADVRMVGVIAKIDGYSSIHIIITILQTEWQTEWLGEYHGINLSQRGL